MVNRGVCITNALEENNLEPIHTGRLIVRHFTQTDLPDLLAYQTHPDMQKYEAMEPKTEEQAAQFLARQADLATWAGAGWLAFAVYHPGDGKVIGEVGVFVEKEPKSEGNIGWMLHPDYHGQGYAAEAAQVLVRYAFWERNLHRLTSGCDARNAPSWKLMERLGMRREGHFRQSRLLRGAWQDEYLYALLREDWLNPEAATPAG